MTVAMEIGWRQAAELCPSSLKTTCASKNKAWTEDPQKILSLMMGKPVDVAAPAAAGGGSVPAPAHFTASETVQLDHEQEPPLPFGWEKRLDLKSGSISFVNCSTGLSTIDDPRFLQTSWLNRSSSLCLDLLQSTKHTSGVNSHLGNEDSSPASTLEEGHLDLELNLGFKAAANRSPAAAAAANLLKGKTTDHKRTSSSSSSDDLSSSRTVVTGCKTCLMYVMLSQLDPSCPRCGSYVAMDTAPVPLPKKFKAQSN